MDKGNEKNNKRIPKAIIEKIKSRIDIVDFVSSKQEIKKSHNAPKIKLIFHYNDPLRAE